MFADSDDETDFSKWMRGLTDEDHGDLFDEEMILRPRVLTQAQIDKIHAQGKETPAEYTARRQRENSSKMNKREVIAEKKEERQENAELPPVKVVPREFRIQVQQARQAANLKQVELAQKVGVKATVIQDFENGKPGAVLSKVVENKIKRVLKM